MDLTQEQIDAIEGIIKRRMTSTGEYEQKLVTISVISCNNYESDEGTTADVRAAVRFYQQHHISIASAQLSRISDI